MNTLATALRQIHELPGPPGLPLLGNVHQLDLPRLHLDLEAWVEKYGSVFKIQMGPQQMAVVSDPAMNAAMLKDRPDGFRRQVRLYDVFADMHIPPGLFFAEGELWERQRRMVMSSFSPGNVRSYFPSLLKVTQRLRGRWQKAAQAQQSFDLQADLMRFTVDAISGLAFGTDTNTIESGDDIIQQHLDKIFPAVWRRFNAVIPYWRLFRMPADRSLDRSIAEVNKAITAFIAQARERLQHDPARRQSPPNLLEAMLVAADAPGSGLTDTDVAGNVFTMLLAGEDTTANTLAWMIYLLKHNPDMLAKAQEEARRVAPNVDDFTPEQMAGLHFIEACANEAMRLKPVAPIMGLEALRDTVVGDLALSKGAGVLMVMRTSASSMNERCFAQAQAFNPERWLEGNSPQDAGNAKRMSIPFGSGPRICPGRYMALLEIKMAMAMLLNSFEIEAVDTPDGQEARELMSFTMTPVGLRMRLKAAG